MKFKTNMNVGYLIACYNCHLVWESHPEDLKQKAVKLKDGTMIIPFQCEDCGKINVLDYDELVVDS